MDQIAALEARVASLLEDKRVLTTALDRAVQRLHDEHARISSVQTEQEKYLLKYRSRINELEAGQNERKQLELQMIAENRKTSELRHLSRLCTRLLRDKAEQEGELAEAISHVNRALHDLTEQQGTGHPGSGSGYTVGGSSTLGSTRGSGAQYALAWPSSPSSGSAARAVSPPSSRHDAVESPPGTARTGGFQRSAAVAPRRRGQLSRPGSRDNGHIRNTGRASPSRRGGTAASSEEKSAVRHEHEQHALEHMRDYSHMIHDFNHVQPEPGAPRMTGLLNLPQLAV
eukprot:SAG11_NODE_1834_length_4188_cov_3.990218_1_plen_286_part_00